jgi:hypothetical protein
MYPQLNSDVTPKSSLPIKWNGHPQFFEIKMEIEIEWK